MAAYKSFDPRAKPPANIQAVFSSHRRKRDLADYNDNVLLDFDVRRPEPKAVNQVGSISAEKILEASLILEDDGEKAFAQALLSASVQERLIFEHEDLQGLYIVPSLLPPRTQQTLVSKLLHRDFSNPEHLTNVHFHHKLPYTQDQRSFFSLPTEGYHCEPLDATSHKPISLQSLLSRKLRWATLGGQYDWTAKKYPSSKPPAFPQDIARFLETLFPEMRAEAAIVNLYSPGDTLSMHRDVAEEAEKGLVSISIGCDAIFVIGLGPDDEPAAVLDTVSEAKPPLVIRVRSGDAVFMNGRSRYAWHGVPQIIPNTCPDFLKSWPAAADEPDGPYEHWRGWMANKRINLNVRQMFD